ncbi:MAG: hypothetical protein ACK5PP_13515 [Acidimicrobiales bacterium]
MAAVAVVVAVEPGWSLRASGADPVSGPVAGRRLRRAVAAVVVVVGLIVVATGATSTLAAVRPLDTGAVAADQVEYLRSVVADGGAAEMGALFPEGEEFTVLLTALADLRLAEEGLTTVPAALASADVALGVLDRPATAAKFGVTDPAGGVFLQGWTLLVATGRARLGGPAERADAELRADRLRIAIAGSLDQGRPFLPSYPGQIWPVDTVVAVAALAQLDAVTGTGASAPLIAAWRAAAEPALDPVRGLFPHRSDGTGRVLEGPRATSSSIIAVFWPDIAPDAAADYYRRHLDAFLVRRWGLVGTAEYPPGVDGGGDVDTGPLVAGMSASATVVTIGAARRVGDERLAATLDQQVEAVGRPSRRGVGRRYVFGLLPVGDAFLAWARTVPITPSAGTPPDSTSSRLWWWSLAVTLAGSALIVVGIRLWRSPRRVVPAPPAPDPRPITGPPGYPERPVSRSSTAGTEPNSSNPAPDRRGLRPSGADPEGGGAQCGPTN